MPAFGGCGCGRFAWRLCYGLLASRVPSPDWAFMNYGFAPLEPGPALPLAASDEPDRHCIQLYQHVVGAVAVQDLDVLEVGSGRGGGAFYVSRYLRPRSVTGLDLSPEAVDLCNRHRKAPGLVFTRGDAQAMPFPDDSFDAVVNVESSHCYPSMDAFLAEVDRVLRPGGSSSSPTCAVATAWTPCTGSSRRAGWVWSARTTSRRTC